jgi:hypothetical protein
VLVGVNVLEELQHKYSEMLAMRLEQDRRRAEASQEPDGGTGTGDTRRMSRLAAQYPGALRELDELELDEIGRRIAALDRAAKGEQEIEAWMVATARFHVLARGALSAKRWLSGRKAVDEDVVRSFQMAVACGSLLYAEDASQWTSDLACVARPPGGKLSRLVLSRVATELGASEAEVRLLVFGAPRRWRSRVRPSGGAPG